MAAAEVTVGQRDKIKGNAAILLLTATEVAAKICRGDIAAESVLCEYIQRIEAVNPAINAVVANRFEVCFRCTVHTFVYKQTVDLANVLSDSIRPWCVVCVSSFWTDPT